MAKTGSSSSAGIKKKTHIFHILTPAPLPPPQKSDGWMVYCLVEIFLWGCQLHGAKKHGKPEKLKRNFLKILKYYTPSKVPPGES